MLANGADAKTAVAGGLCVMPVRMAYDYFVNKTMPPPPVIAQTLAIVGARRPLLRAARPRFLHSSWFTASLTKAAVQATASTR